MSIRGKEIEIDSLLSREEYLTYRPLPVPEVDRPRAAIVDATFKQEPSQRHEKTTILLPEDKGLTSQKKLLQSNKIRGSFRTPLLQNTNLSKKHTPVSVPTPRHDPLANGALVMKRPTRITQGKHVVDVVVDPILSKKLRPHQQEGVKFLYECVMGLRVDGLHGALLADDMGLGKTLQIIALLWTLLKQNPLHEDQPIIRKALVVCPVTLVKNWRREFRKWLGLDRLGVFVFDDNKRRITDFTRGKAYSIMIIGYEKMRTFSEELLKSQCIDIVIADEGHRLKTANNKSGQAIRSLDIPKRVILSGTPIQNDLSEFYTMVDFINPDVLGSLKSFTRDFELPIIKSRQPGAHPKDVEKGKARGDELAGLTNTFILRRTADILAKYLPEKSEYVLLCRPTRVQASVYEYILSSPFFQSIINSAEASLQLITILKKACNSPWLLKEEIGSSTKSSDSSLAASLLAGLPSNIVCNNQGSAKLRALDRLLYRLKTTTDEKVVLVSNYTSTLEILESLLTSLGYPYLRLDGSTPSKKRQDLVDDFNRSSAASYFAFLLSAKAGGVGINLIGASRLILFVVDWNPAIDLQATARIHRDGQKRPCIIYRLLLAGAIDEKIWQRQMTKLGLATNIMDQKAGASSFTREELRDLFRLEQGSSCQTHDLLGCSCTGRGLPKLPSEGEVQNRYIPLADDDLPEMPQVLQANKFDMREQERKIEASKSDKQSRTNMDSLMSYVHIETSMFSTGAEDVQALIDDEILLSTLREEDNPISFIFAKHSG